MGSAARIDRAIAGRLEGWGRSLCRVPATPAILPALKVQDNTMVIMKSGDVDDETIVAMLRDAADSIAGRQIIRHRH
jgi:hypothetical protein